MKVDLAIVVPCYNEEEVLNETTRQLTAVLADLEVAGKIKAGKIVYVDDGSRDRTWELICSFARQDGRVCGLKLAHNAGHQRALWAGMEWAAGHAEAAVQGRAAGERLMERSAETRVVQFALQIVEAELV